MRSRTIAIVATALLIAAVSGALASRMVIADPTPPDSPARSARLFIDGASLVAGHVASHTVTRLRLPAGDVAWRTDVGCAPATLARSGSRVLVACEDTGELLALDSGNGGVTQRTAVGHGAFGVLVAGSRVYVTLAHDNSLVALRADTLAPLGRAATGREPRGIAWSAGRLAVVHLLDASVRLYDPLTLADAGTIEIGQQAAMAESLAPAAARLYVPHERLNVTNLDRHFDTTVFPVIEALDPVARAPVRRESLALDAVDTPVGQPLAAVVSANGARLYTANATSDDLSVIDLARGIGVGHIVVGTRPRDLALSPDGAFLYTLNESSNDVSVVDLAAGMVTRTLPLATDPRPAAVRRGATLFGTSRLPEVARDHWIACASCHLDGGLDGQTWLGTDEGVRNTTILRGIRGTEPLHWSGTRADVRAFQKTFVELMAGTGLTPGQLDDLQAFTDSLTPLASPQRDAAGALALSAVAGAAVFRAAGCGSCHAAPLFTDRALHDVGTEGAFKTPSLRELWLTAPYLHDGRAPTLSSLFSGPAPHGGAALAVKDVDALVTFLESLPLTPSESARLLP